VKKQPVALVILDGWGVRDSAFFNAIAMARTPCYRSLLKKYPSTQLQASGPAVGLPDGFAGNSEVGHLTMGAGRRIKQLLSRIDEALESDYFEQNVLLHEKLELLKKNNGTLHLIGLLSDGGVHSHERHLYALIAAAVHVGIKKIFIHAILDGRDTPPQSAALYLERLNAECTRLGGGSIASIMGRFYAMDRDENWDRTLLAFECLKGDLKSARTDPPSTGSQPSLKLRRAGRTASHSMQAVHTDISIHCAARPECFPQESVSKGLYERPWQEILECSYSAAVFDEYIVPQVLLPETRIGQTDGVILFNFRADRMRQLAGMLLGVQPEVRKKAFPGVFPATCSCAWVLSMTRYSSEFHNEVLFEKEPVSHTLLDELEAIGKEVFVIAETEKYAHVTYFFSGGREVIRPHECRELVPSLPVRSYADAPEMSAATITKKVLSALEEDRFDFFLINYANADMVGHTGNFESAVKAVECLDAQLQALYQAFVLERQGTLFITADHGNAEEMWDEVAQATKTAHTANPVPLMVVGEKTVDLKHVSELADIAPLILQFFGLAVPVEMK